MIELDEYPYKYPNLLVEIVEFFSAHHGFGSVDTTKERRTILKFCQYYQAKYGIADMPPFTSIARLCEKLVEHKFLSVLVKDTPHNFDDSYVFLPGDGRGAIFKDDALKNILHEKLNCLVFGFKYINNQYRDTVLPICHYKSEDPEIGTTFKFWNGIVTAKHCVEGARKLSIRGISKEILRDSEFLIHEVDAMDLIFIKLPEGSMPGFKFVEFDEGHVLDEVLALGFPKIPGFHTFMTAEKGTISSRYTSSIGAIASISEDIWMRQNLMLITAKIKGGNSGGPIINRKGNVVGIASNIPTAKGNYDDLGYGTVIPVKFLAEIIDGKSKLFDISNIEFVDFID